MDLPTNFGKYLLLKKLALGGMAEIFLAKAIGAEGFQRDVVIKRILPSYSEDEAFVTMFIDEARIAARLNHPNIVQIFDFDRVDECYYIAMEYVEGRDLRKILDRGLKSGHRLSTLQVVQATAEIAAGLKYAHSRRGEDGVPLDLVHRDVSPHNILVAYTGEVKLTDFGIAKAAARSTKTRAGTVKGKCAYMSPEQARGKALDGRSDVYALCTVAWEMLAGRKAFDGETDFEILNNVLHQEVPPPSSLNPAVDADLDAILARGLQKDRDARYPDMAALEKDLRAYAFKRAGSLEELSLGPYMQELFAEEIAVIEAGTHVERVAAGTPRAVQAVEPAPAPVPAPAAGPAPTVPASPQPPRKATLMDDPSLRAAREAAAREAVVREAALRAAVDTIPPGADGEATMALMDEAPATVPVGQLARQVNELVERGAVVPPPAEATPPAPRERGSAPVPAVAEIGGARSGGLGKWIAAAAVLVVLLAVGAWVLFAPGDAPPAAADVPALAAVTDVPPTAEADAAVAAAPDVVLAAAPDPGPAAVPDPGTRVAVSDSGPKTPPAATKVEPPVAKPPVVVKPPVTPKTPVPVETGLVTLNARPWADVYFRGRKIGTTPIRDFEVPVGTQTFVLKNAVTSRTVRVTVVKGRTATSVVDM